MFLFPSIIAFLYELILMIPLIGGAIVIGSQYTALTVALVIHVIVLITRFATGHSKIVPVLAILLTFLAWIPLLGWVIHSVITLIYLVDMIIGVMRGPR